MLAQITHEVRNPLNALGLNAELLGDELERLDPVARFTWADGQTFELKADEEAMLQEVRRFAPDDATRPSRRSRTALRR